MYFFFQLIDFTTFLKYLLIAPFWNILVQNHPLVNKKSFGIEILKYNF